MRHRCPPRRKDGACLPACPTIATVCVTRREIRPGLDQVTDGTDEDEGRKGTKEDSDWPRLGPTDVVDESGETAEEYYVVCASIRLSETNSQCEPQDANQLILHTMYVCALVWYIRCDSMPWWCRGVGGSKFCMPASVGPALCVVDASIFFAFLLPLLLHLLPHFRLLDTRQADKTRQQTRRDRQQISRPVACPNRNPPATACVAYLNAGLWPLPSSVFVPHTTSTPLPHTTHTPHTHIAQSTKHTTPPSLTYRCYVPLVNAPGGGGGLFSMSPASVEPNRTGAIFFLLAFLFFVSVAVPDQHFCFSLLFFKSC